MKQGNISSGSGLVGKSHDKAHLDMAGNAMVRLEEEANRLLELNSRFGQNMTSSKF